MMLNKNISIRIEMLSVSINNSNRIYCCRHYELVDPWSAAVLYDLSDVHNMYGINLKTKT